MTTADRREKRRLHKEQKKKFSYAPARVGVGFILRVNRGHCKAVDKNPCVGGPTQGNYFFLWNTRPEEFESPTF